MNQVEIFVRHDAELDALGYFQHIHKYNPDAATRFLAAIDQTLKVWRFSRSRAGCESSVAAI